MKAVVLGGSNGIGLAISARLINLGYYVEILDICEPDSYLKKYADSYQYHKFDLLDIDNDLLETFVKDDSIDLLMVTAGFGRVADFESLNAIEIDKIFRVNTIGVIKVIRKFYEKIKSNSDFYCGLMGSIAGMISSPLFSVYAASKAALCRFTESVNIELQAEGFDNRILNVSPGSIKGTKFSGADENQLDMIGDLSQAIVANLFDRKELYIPEYEEIYKNVIERYNNNPLEFGLSSYQYKKSSGRVDIKSNIKIGYLSGTFDLFHVGHLNLLQRAKEHCDYLIVGVHPDASHKGKETFIPFEERKRVVGAVRYVDKVVQSCPEDSEAWDLWHYDRLFVGSDYKGTERFNRYEEYFKDKGVEIVYFPYTQSTSSTQIRKTVLLKTKDIKDN